MINKNLRLLRLITLVFSILAALKLALFPVGVLAAVAPGCYDLRPNDNLYQLVESCNDSTKDSAVRAEGACYVNIVRAKRTPTYDKVDCASIGADKLFSDAKCVNGDAVPAINQTEQSKAAYCKDQGSSYFVLNPSGSCEGKTGDCIVDDIQLGINVLSMGVGIVITISIVVAGIQYATARSNPQAVQAAKTRIVNSVIALLGFVFIYAFLQWIVPGGIFN